MTTGRLGAGIISIARDAQRGEPLNGRPSSMTPDEPEREKITASLRECAQLDWIDCTFAAATMREAADEIESLRTSLHAAEKRAEGAEAELVRTIACNIATVKRVESERDSAREALGKVDEIIDWHKAQAPPDSSVEHALIAVQQAIRSALKDAGK